jgi:hypothetical protein
MPLLFHASQGTRDSIFFYAAYVRSATRLGYS